MKKQILIFLSLLSLPSLVFADFGDRFEGGWGGHHMGNYMGNFHGGGWLMMTGFFILTIITLVFVGKWIIGNKKTLGSNAQSILLERFAKGEIDEETFKNMRKSLK